MDKLLADILSVLYCEKSKYEKMATSIKWYQPKHTNSLIDLLSVFTPSSTASLIDLLSASTSSSTAYTVLNYRFVSTYQQYVENPPQN